MHKSKKESTHIPLFILGGVVLYFLSGMVDELRVYQGASIAVSLAYCALTCRSKEKGD